MHLSKSAVKAIIGKIYRKIRHPSPLGMKEMGDNSFIFMPRKIRGRSCIEIGKGTQINNHAWIDAIERYQHQKFTPNIKIGDNVHVGQYSCIMCIDTICIDDGCVLSEYVYITDLFHGFDPTKGLIMNQNLISKGNVKIGESSFIGYRACIMPGVTLGKHCVVGANSVVTKSFPDYSMIAGSPAKLIKTFSFEKQDWVSV
jgi:acetyltransferase-like isoleucine patch superfamily enzyme